MVIIINEIILFLLNYLPPQIIPLPFLPFVHLSSFPHIYLIVALLPTMFAFLAPSSSRLLIARSSLRDLAFLLLPLLRPHRLLLIARPSLHGCAFIHFPLFFHRHRVFIAHLSFCRRAFLCPPPSVRHHCLARAPFALLPLVPRPPAVLPSPLPSPRHSSFDPLLCIPPPAVHDFRHILLLLLPELLLNPPAISE